MAKVVRLRIELEFNGRGKGWTDVTEDVQKPSGIETSRGIRSRGPRARIATTGLLTLALINSVKNSGGLLGHYTPGHVNVRPGFESGIGARVSVVIGPESSNGWVTPDWAVDWVDTEIETTDVRVVWTGSITRIRPMSGVNLQRLSFIEARDYIDQLARHRLTGLDVETDITESDTVQAVLDEMPRQPRGQQIDTGLDTYDFAFDLTRDESTVPLQEFQRIALSSMGLIYILEDGTFVYEARNSKRSITAAPTINILESDLRNIRPPNIEDASIDTINRVQTVLSLRRIDPSEVVLYRAVQPIPFDPGGPVDFRGLFTDSTQRSVRAGGTSLVAPVASTDYVFNTESDGSGTDVTASITVTASFSSNSVLFAITNNTSLQVFATTLQARGIGVLAQEKVTFEAVDTVAISAVGENVVTVTMPYQSNTTTAREAAQWLLFVLSQEVKRLNLVPLWLDPKNVTRSLEILDMDISDVFTFDESMTAFDGEGFFINAIEIIALPDDTVWVLWTPTIADSSKFWRIGTAGLSEIGVTTNVGPGFLT